MVVFIGCAPSGHNQSQPIAVQTAITTNDAIRIAREACDGIVYVPITTQTIVTETNGHFIVTFPQPIQPEVLHGDIYARLTIDKRTGSIKDIEVSP